MACIDFTDLVVDDTIALEGLQNFTICVGDSSSMVVIVDDDSEIYITFSTTTIHMLCFINHSSNDHI